MIPWFSDSYIFFLTLTFFNFQLHAWRMLTALFKDFIAPRLLGAFCCLMASFFWEPRWLGVPGDLKSVNKWFGLKDAYFQLKSFKSFKSTSHESRVIGQYQTTYRHSKKVQMKNYEIQRPTSCLVLGVGKWNQLLVSSQFIPIYLDSFVCLIPPFIGIQRQSYGKRSRKFW